MLFFSCQQMSVDNSGWQTHFEKSGGTETPRYQETMEYFNRLAQASPYAEMLSFGISPEGRDLGMMIISSDRAFTPEKAKDINKPVIFIQCCIHPGESDGKDAAMMLARDILIHHKYPQLMQDLVTAIIPIFNVDGHERFGPYNRINQNGPSEMGFRVTSQRLNLNRDFVKADAPEMRDWLRMYHQWKPHLLIDCHVTDGMDHQYVIAYNIDVHPEFGGAVSSWAKDTFLPAIIPAFEKTGHYICPYAGFIDKKAPEKGLRGGVWPPMLSNPYATVRNRAGFLIESHSLKPYKQRVEANYELLRVIMEHLAANPNALMDAVASEDERASSMGCQSAKSTGYPLTFKVDESQGDSILWRGKDFVIQHGPVSGSDYIRYLGDNKDIKTVYYNDVQPDISIIPPAGYLVPPQWTEVIDVLEIHGAALYRLRKDLTNEFEGYRFTDVKFAASPYEGRQKVSYQVEPVNEKRTFTKGSVFVPLCSPESKIIMQILEPYAPDALVRWGFLNSIFERKEYFESYVMEPMAQEMMADDPELKAEFEDKLKDDNAFAGSPRERLMFFYKKSPYWDIEKDLYPVARVTEPIENSYLESYR